METKQHKHHDVMIALAGNPYLVIEYRRGNSDWNICEYPAFNPDYQYRIQCDIAISEHYELLRLFASNADLQFQRQAHGEGSWVDVPSTQIEWGSNIEYRIKPKPHRMQIGDMMASKTTSLMVIVTATPSDDDPGHFSGVVVRSSNLTITGQLDDDWVVGAFTRVENTLENS